MFNITKVEFEYAPDMTNGIGGQVQDGTIEYTITPKYIRIFDVHNIKEEFHYYKNPKLFYDLTTAIINTKNIETHDYIDDAEEILFRVYHNDTMIGITRLFYNFHKYHYDKIIEALEALFKDLEKPIFIR